jgi:putative ABC transport system permease protein
MIPTNYRNRLRERLAAEGLTPSAHREAIDEIAEHLNDLHQAAERAGRSPEEASAIVEAELARMGPLALAVVERATRRERFAHQRAPLHESVIGDLKQALRTLRVDRGFAATVIVTLAIGIGACTTVFSFIDALLIDSLPFPNPDRLLLLWESDPADREKRNIVARPVYDDWEKETRTLSSLGIWEYQSFNITSAHEPEQVRGIRSSSSLFAVLGVAPALGRVFTDQEDLRQEKVVVISDAVWRTHLGGDQAALGKPLRLNGDAYQVIGVMPPGFVFPQQGNGVWVPFAIQEQDKERASHSFFVAGRMRPDVTFEQARADVEQVGRALQQRYRENSEEGSTATLMAMQGLRQVRSMLTALMGAVLFILMIGCVNVANLQFGRGLKRRREFALRLSLGAGLRRLARQLFVESLVLAAGGGIAGLAVAWLALRGADFVLTPGFRTLPFRGEVALTIDGTVLAFAAVIALLCAAVFGFAPLIGLGRREPNTLLREGERGSTPAGNVARKILVGIEVALAIVVLCGAGLMIKSLSGLLQVSPGLDPRDVLTMIVSLPQIDTYGPPVRQSFCADLSRETADLPGIRTIGAISHLPLSGASAGRALTVEGYTPTDEHVSAAYRVTCPGYFSALGISIIEGRDFNHRDATNGVPVAIINRLMAEKYWKHGESPLGRRVKIGGPQSDNPWMTVIGITENVRHFGLDSDAQREIFVPYSQLTWPQMTVVAKTIGEPMAWQTPLKEVLKRIDPGMPVGVVRSMEQWIGASVDWRETPMKLLTGFAIIGLLLASLGVYGVLGYYVSQRTREIGVRAALGATRGQLATMVIRQSLLPIVAGVIVGVADRSRPGGCCRSSCIKSVRAIRR